MREFNDKECAMPSFRTSLATQRWDDHRFYHQSYVNQSLHLLSSISFLFCYVLLWKDPAIAALIAWIVSMGTRQSGHFFFEPRGYDTINHVTHEYKEEVKVGYNLSRKRVLMAIWALSPLLLVIDPTLAGIFQPAASKIEYLRQVGYIWFAIGVGGILFRVIQLSVEQDFMTGVVWVTKILTDPFHDIMLYYKSPLYIGRKPASQEPHEEFPNAEFEPRAEDEGDEDEPAPAPALHP